jgi:hypothetical protein
MAAAYTSLKDRSETEVSATLSQLSTRLSAAEEVRSRLAAYRSQAENL